MVSASDLGLFCQADSGPIWVLICASNLHLSIDFPNRLSENKIDQEKYINFDSESRYLFQSIWSRFGAGRLVISVLCADRQPDVWPRHKRKKHEIGKE